VYAERWAVPIDEKYLTRQEKGLPGGITEVLRAIGTFGKIPPKRQKKADILGGHDSLDQMCDSSGSFFSANT
jgi:hypothetical protein